MKNVQYWILIVAMASPSFAQPPEEEIAPVAPEFNIEVTEIPTEESSSTDAALEETPVNEAPLTTKQKIDEILEPLPSQPLAPPIQEQVAATGEVDKSVKGITLTPVLAIRPIGHELGVNQWYFEFNPGVALDTMFKTAGGRDISISFAYQFLWDEYFNKRLEAGKRYFEHELEGSAKIDWTEVFSTELYADMDYSLRASTEREATLFIDNWFTTTFKIIDQVSVSPGYHLWYFDNIDEPIRLSDGTFPNDADEVRQGNAAFGASNPFATDPFGNPIANSDPAVDNVWFANNGIFLKGKYQPIEQTKIEPGYEYVFTTFTNSSNAAWTGHYVALKITQAMPWKGGSASLTDQIRIRNFDTKTIPETTLSLSDFRNRLTFEYKQAVTEALSTKFWYRWQLLSSNKDNYAGKENGHGMYFSMAYSF